MKTHFGVEILCLQTTFSGCLDKRRFWRLSTEKYFISSIRLWTQNESFCDSTKLGRSAIHISPKVSAIKTRKCAPMLEWQPATFCFQLDTQHNFAVCQKRWCQKKTVLCRQIADMELFRTPPGAIRTLLGLSVKTISMPVAVDTQTKYLKEKHFPESSAKICFREKLQFRIFREFSN